MNDTLESQSASTLRNLLIEGVKKFILCLDNGSTAELDAMRFRLRTIYDLIVEKEQNDQRPLAWGKNSALTQTATPQFDSNTEIIPGAPPPERP
jgi:hypothetical protein